MGQILNFKDNRFNFELGEHDGKNIIWVRFEKDHSLINFLKAQIKTARFSWSKQAWYVPNNKYTRGLFGLRGEIVGKEAMAKISLVNSPALKRLQDLIVMKGYSKNTLETYSREFSQLLYILKNVNVDTLTAERLRSYFLYCNETLRLSENEIHSRMNAVKFYFEQVLKRDKMFFNEIPRPKKKSSLPKVISKKDIVKLFSVVENPKHLLLLKLCYGMGLRVSEIVALKISNIDSDRMMVHIENAKGKKDRMVLLPQTVIESLQVYYKEYKPKDYLFEGQYGGQYSIRSVQAVFRAAMKKAKINKAVGIHGLRHSYATHLMEAGTDMAFIQELLGHKDIKTTQIYAKVGQKQIKNIKSPLDDM